MFSLWLSLHTSDWLEYTKTSHVFCTIWGTLSASQVTCTTPVARYTLDQG